MTTIKLDPRTFISAPYVKCPKCGRDSFGILMISDHSYFRRCRECLYPRGTEPQARYPLPELRKKIIYIDQFAVSNMMKALNPDTKAYKKGTLDDFWLRLFERLDSLCKLQLVICPASGFHTDESLLSPYFEPLKRMYQLLNGGVNFYDHETVKRFQLCEHAKNWISGEATKELNLDVHSVVHGNINAWQDKLIVSMNMQYGVDWVDDLREARKKIHEQFSEVFKRWRSETNRTFDDWFEEEAMSFGRVTLGMYWNDLKRFAGISSGRVALTVNDLFPSPSVVLIHSIHNVFRNAGIQECDIWPTTVEYLTSRCVGDVPFVKISSMLYAALARKAAAGQKNPPNQGMVNDIRMVSALLPYCDAMFVDKECHSYLNEQPLSVAIDYGTRVFSLHTKAEFTKYLDEIEVNASKKQLDKVDELYGKDWREPYTTLYRK